MKTHDAVKNLVTEPLGTISTANGFNTDPAVINGWLSMYVDDLVLNKDGIGFPVVAVQYSKENYKKPNSSSGDVITSRILEVVGAVDVTNPDEITLKLDQLLTDVKNALGIARKVTIVDTTFILPEGSIRYVGFNMTVSVEINETWSTPTP